MGKGPGKSSATSATRKKHLKKHAPPPEEPVPKTKKDKKARAKKEPRQKIYIPPVKPAPVQPDPLETTGLAHSLPPDLLVVLRNFNKKAEVTKIRALEELQAGWVAKCVEDEVVEYNVVQMLPVWLHHAPSLFLHPSRRVRALTATVHLSLLRIAAAKEQVLFFLHETASTAQVESLLGSWCVAAHDADKAVATTAMESWNDSELKPDTVALLEFVQRTALDPAGIYAYLNPVQPSVAPPSHPGSKKKGPPPPKANPEPSKLDEENEENEQDRKARLRFGALGALRWMLESLDPLPEGLLSLFGNPALLTSLQPSPRTPGVDIEAFGYGQPIVRKNMWTLLQTLLLVRKGKLQDVASELARAILRSAFVETDSNVQLAIWYPLLLFLKEFPHSWEIEVNTSREEEEDDEEGEGDDNPKPPPTTSAAYTEFLQFLQLGCSGSPIQGYPTIVIILSTISSPIIAASSSTPLDDLFTSFWAVLDGRALSSLNRQASSAAFLSSLLECMILILKRLTSATLERDVLAKLISGGEGTAAEFSTRVVEEQLGRMWREIIDGKLKVTEEQAAKTIVKTADGLKEVDLELSNTVWDTLTSSIHASSLTHSKLVARVVKELQKETQALEEWQAKLDPVIAELAERSLEGFTTATAVTVEAEESSKQRQGLLIELLSTFKHGLFSVSDTFRTQLDAIISDEVRAHELLKANPAVFLAILEYRGFDSPGTALAQAAWRSVLGNLTKPEAPKAEREGLLKVLVDAVRRGALPEYLRVYEGMGGEGTLDDLVGRSVVEVVGGRREGVDVLWGLLGHHGFFISTDAFLGIFETLCKSLASEIRSVFEDPFFLPSGSANDGTIPWPALETLFLLVLSTYTTIVPARQPTFTTPAIHVLAPDAFLFAYLLPLCEGIEEAGKQRSFELAKELWERWFSDALEAGKGAEKGKSRASVGLKEVRGRLKGFILGTKTRVLPQTVLTLLLTPGASSEGKTGAHQFFSAHPEFSTDTILEFLPDIAELDSMLVFLLPTISPSPSMGVLEPLVPPSTAYPYSSPARAQVTLPENAMGDAFSTGRYARGDADVSGYDRYGYSAYARAVSALVSVFARDRACVRAKEGVEMLRHAAALEVCAWDALCVPSSLGSAGQPQKVFGESVPLKESGEVEIPGELGKDVWSLTEIISKVEQVSAYAFLTTGGREHWKKYIIESLAGATAKVSPSASDAPTMDERGDLVTGGVKKTMHATMNRLSFFVLEVVGRSVQAEVDLKAGIALSPSVNDERSSKDKVKGMRGLVVLRARVLRRVLERVFDGDEDDDQGTSSGEGLGMQKGDVDGWVGYARRIERVAPLTSSTILGTLTSLGLDSPRLDRARNEFAASLLGVQPPKANTEGLELLRGLGLCVPKDESEDDGSTARMMTGSNGVNLGGRGGSRRGGSDVIMLPVQRAVNVVRACQNWVEGQPTAGGDSDSEDEEGPSEDLESAMLAVFVGLAPILQNVIGKHWEFMWDVVETVVENSTLEDESALLGLSHALKFVHVTEELVRTNKQLKAEWNSRRVSILGSIKDLVLDEQDADSSQDVVNPRLNSIPRAVCREHILSIVPSLPDELMDRDTLGKMCHLTLDPSIEVQRLSYAMLKHAADKRTEWIVIEVGVGSMGGEGEGEPGANADGMATGDGGEIAATFEAAVEPDSALPAPASEATPEQKVGRRKDGRKRGRRQEPVVKDEGPSLLPKELLAIVQRDEELDWFGWMLGWMLVFDLFKDASFKVKSMYIEQLRNLDLIGQRLLPAIVHLLGLDKGPTSKVVKLWAVDEFYVAYYDPTSAPALAAHIYYRALLSVPSLISTWVSRCKDRQLTKAITALTSAQFSPLIIRTELAHLKSPEGIAELSGDGFSVKVIGGGGSGASGEVVAAYSVDEHQLELRLRIPNDWPLHMIEVRDERPVGVDERRWRAWVMGVQQTIWLHSGRMVDGLSLWKKNVIGHFEGQVECAICYSIISASDGTLPKKPCKTCKNGFHAGCLFKWFKTSHSSSCPLCRSNII